MIELPDNAGTLAFLELLAAEAARQSTPAVAPPFVASKKARAVTRAH